ncbi:MAG: hypothetical protein QXF52_05700 [Thermoproteota archaeon]
MRLEVQKREPRLIIKQLSLGSQLPPLSNALSLFRPRQKGHASDAETFKT